MKLMAFCGGMSAVGYACYKTYILPLSGAQKTIVNTSLRKEDPKVVNMVDIEELSQEKTAYCRCWRSKKVCHRFPVYSYLIGLIAELNC